MLLLTGCCRCLATPVLKKQKSIRNWIRAWGRVPKYRDIPGYRRMSWTARKKLDCRAVCLAVRTGDFWRAVFIVLAGVLLANILGWQFDLTGWRRDLIRCLPVVMAAPGTATLRRRLIVQLLKGREFGR